MVQSSKENQEEEEEEEEEEDMPEDVKAVKERLEKENPNKRYKYRKSKKEMPGIGQLLVEDQVKPKTWLELIGFPALLAILFAISFAIFMWVDPINNSKYSRGRFSTQSSKRRAHYQQREQQRGQPEPVRILEKKGKEEDYRSPDDEF